MPARRIVSVLCTLGPSSLNRGTIERLQSRGVDLFRINLSHTPLERVAETIRTIQSFSNVPVCLDTEGAQVRTGTMAADAEVHDRQHVVLTAETIAGNASRFTLTPPRVFENLKPNTLIGVDFDGVVLLVLQANANGVDTVVLNGGRIGSNKAVTVDPAPVLPPLSAKDVQAVKIGLEYGVRHFALSFANSADDVKQLRELVGPDSTIISKIESKRGVRNIDAILTETDEILIDRGDLSREVPLENLPFLQKAIIRKANIAKVPVNVATNLLESMIVNRKPTRAELNDIVNTMLDGANGLVLAAETAIGSHPVRTVDIVLGLIERYRRSLEGFRIADLLDGGSVLLPSPHGEPSTPSPVALSQDSAARRHSSRYPSIEIDLETAMDVEQIAHGVYSPLRGFMTRDELESVLNRHRLPDGQVWTMPIVLQGKSQEFAAFQPGQSIRLIDQRTGESTAILHLEDKYEIELENVAKRWFGTADRAHPGVARFMSKGVTLLGGPIEYLGPASVARSPYQLTPQQTRMVFDIKGWTKIVAFHTRNVPHRGHEHVIANACERASADGIFIHPVIGPKKAGDFTQQAVMGAYERLISARVPNALLAAFSTYSRYCGPREAVFTALCRKNFGCTHFVLGRDHTGVGGFYTANQNRDLFEELGDIGITPVFFDSVHFSDEADDTIESATLGDGRAISGTAVRDLLVQGQAVPDWCMRSDISNWLLEMQGSGQPLFID
ncbi:pyruvate kinase [Lacipirellula parvula]|uniref:Pyruvate kinase n=1 Tax=Lacipirellula parvula TaxID=2650471 RepID=A0A5K7X4B2_9BACT|nr:pyruvate kinase [Lacipirellula parvula]BBO31225.1 pyruvate kinase [Lacipirellula parvula]